MLARTIDVRYKVEAPQHRARDPVDLRDPLLHAMMKAKRGQAKSLATKEQTLAEMVLKMRLVDAMKR
jgi:hypothetical protein